MGETITLQLDLQEGFDGNTIVILIDGQESWRKKGVQTKYQIGLADSFSTRVPTGTVKITIEQPDMHQTHNISLPLDGPTYVGIVRSEDGCITHKEQIQPFHYL